MKFVLAIQCDNAAFGDEDDEDRDTVLAAEVASILKNTARRIEDGSEYMRLHDSNGNAVGVAQFTKD